MPGNSAWPVLSRCPSPARLRTPVGVRIALNPGLNPVAFITFKFPCYMRHSSISFSSLSVSGG